VEEFAPVLRTKLVVCLLCLLLPEAAWNGQKKNRPESFGVIAGTVFHESGRSLPGAQITVTPKPSEGETSRRTKALKAVADARGEFAIRVPAGAFSYNIRVEAKGFHPEEKQVTTNWDERVDIFFRLRPNESEAGESK
jgi:hypothetical protein